MTEWLIHASGDQEDQWPLSLRENESVQTFPSSLRGKVSQFNLLCLFCTVKFPFVVKLPSSYFRLLSLPFPHRHSITLINEYFLLIRSTTPCYARELVASRTLESWTADLDATAFYSVSNESPRRRRERSTTWSWWKVVKMGRRKRGRKGVVNQALYNVRYPSRYSFHRSYSAWHIGTCALERISDAPDRSKKTRT